MKDRVEIAKPASKFCKTRLPQKMEADGALAQRRHEVLKSPALCAEKTLQEMHWGNQKEKHSIRADDRRRISRNNWRRFSRNNWQGIRKRIIVVERWIMPSKLMANTFSMKRKVFFWSNRNTL